MGMTWSELCLKKRTLSSVSHLGREGVGGDSLKHPSPLRVSVSVKSRCCLPLAGPFPAPCSTCMAHVSDKTG